MRPAPRARRAGQACLASRNGLVSSSATIVSQRSAGNSSIGATCWTPALGTTRSRRPKRSIAAWTAPLRGRDRSDRRGGGSRAVRVGLEIDGQHVIAVDGQTFGHRAADPARGSGHERGTATGPGGSVIAWGGRLSGLAYVQCRTTSILPIATGQSSGAPGRPSSGFPPRARCPRPDQTRMSSDMATVRRELFPVPPAGDQPTDVPGTADTSQVAGSILFGSPSFASERRRQPAPLTRAETLCDLGRWSDAARAAQEAVIAAPRDPLAWCVSARAQIGLGRARAALQAAQTASALDPRAEEPHHLASLALEQLGLEAKSASAAEDATRTAPKSWRAYARLARCLAVLSDRLPEARQAAERARALAPEEPGPHLAVGAVALAAGRPSDATSAYCAALGADPQCFEAHSHLASLGDKRPARLGPLAGCGSPGIRADLRAPPQRRDVRARTSLSGRVDPRKWIFRSHPSTPPSPPLQRRSVRPVTRWSGSPPGPARTLASWRRSGLPSPKR